MHICIEIYPGGCPESLVNWGERDMDELRANRNTFSCVAGAVVAAVVTPDLLEFLVHINLLLCELLENASAHIPNHK
jgi:hypothetical protein